LGVPLSGATKYTGKLRFENGVTLPNVLDVNLFQTNNLQDIRAWRLATALSNIHLADVHRRV
jgi:hypothetical protein